MGEIMMNAIMDHIRRYFRIGKKEKSIEFTKKVNVFQRLVYPALITAYTTYMLKHIDSALSRRIIVNTDKNVLGVNNYGLSWFIGEAYNMIGDEIYSDTQYEAEYLTTFMISKTRQPVKAEVVTLSDLRSMTNDFISKNPQHILSFLNKKELEGKYLAGEKKGVKLKLEGRADVKPGLSSGIEYMYGREEGAIIEKINTRAYAQILRQLVNKETRSKIVIVKIDDPRDPLVPFLMDIAAMNNNLITVFEDIGQIIASPKIFSRIQDYLDHLLFIGNKSLSDITEMYLDISTMIRSHLLKYAEPVSHRESMALILRCPDLYRSRRAKQLGAVPIFPRLLMDTIIQFGDSMEGVEFIGKALSRIHALRTLYPMGADREIKGVEWIVDKTLSKESVVYELATQSMLNELNDKEIGMGEAKILGYTGIISVVSGESPKKALEVLVVVGAIADEQVRSNKLIMYTHDHIKSVTGLDDRELRQIVDALIKTRLLCITQLDEQTYLVAAKPRILSTIYRTVSNKMDVEITIETDPLILDTHKISEVFGLYHDTELAHYVSMYMKNKIQTISYIQQNKK